MAITELSPADHLAPASDHLSVMTDAEKKVAIARLEAFGPQVVQTMHNMAQFPPHWATLVAEWLAGKNSEA